MTTSIVCVPVWNTLNAPYCRDMDFKWVIHCIAVDLEGKFSPMELQSSMTRIGEELSRESAKADVESTDSKGDGFDNFVV